MLEEKALQSARTDATGTTDGLISIHEGLNVEAGPVEVTRRERVDWVLPLGVRDRRVTVSRHRTESDVALPRNKVRTRLSAGGRRIRTSPVR